MEILHQGGCLLSFRFTLEALAHFRQFPRHYLDRTHPQIPHPLFHFPLFHHPLFWRPRHCHVVGKWWVTGLSNATHSLWYMNSSRVPCFATVVSWRTVPCRTAAPREEDQLSKSPWMPPFNHANWLHSLGGNIRFLCLMSTVVSLRKSLHWQARTRD